MKIPKVIPPPKSVKKVPRVIPARSPLKAKGAPAVYPKPSQAVAPRPSLSPSLPVTVAPKPSPSQAPSLADMELGQLGLVSGKDNDSDKEALAFLALSVPEWWWQDHKEETWILVETVEQHSEDSEVEVFLVSAKDNDKVALALLVPDWWWQDHKEETWTLVEKHSDDGEVEVCLVAAKDNDKEALASSVPEWWWQDHKEETLVEKHPSEADCEMELGQLGLVAAKDNDKEALALASSVPEWWWQDHKEETLVEKHPSEADCEMELGQLGLVAAKDNDKEALALALAVPDWWWQDHKETTWTLVEVEEHSKDGEVEIGLVSNDKDKDQEALALSVPDWWWQDHKEITWTFIEEHPSEADCAMELGLVPGKDNVKEALALSVQNKVEVCHPGPSPRWKASRKQAKARNAKLDDKRVLSKVEVRHLDSSQEACYQDKFSCGRSVSQLVMDLWDGKVSLCDPFLKLTVFDTTDRKTNERILLCTDSRRLLALKEFAKISGDERMLVNINFFSEDTINTVRRYHLNCDHTHGYDVRLRRRLHKEPPPKRIRRSEPPPKRIRRSNRDKQGQKQHVSRGVKFRRHKI